MRTATTSAYDCRDEDGKNHAREGGGAIFFVSNDRTGVVRSVPRHCCDNPSDGFETDPGIFFLGRDQNDDDSLLE